MNTQQRTAPRQEVAGAPPMPATQVARMRAAIDRAVAVGPGFLRGEVDANRMANTMVGAVRGYVDQERAAGSDGKPHDNQARELQGILAELMTCGSGFLARRCDAACVARTMTQMVREFGVH
ncbi:MAG: hypothetical protein ACREPL_03040 [Rhodanobacteraceae bacterium]